MWNMMGLQLAPRSVGIAAGVDVDAFSRFATWPIASPEADEISPMIIATFVASISVAWRRRSAG